MIRVARTISLISLAVASACDPIAGVHLRQGFTPVPSPNCVRNALVGSPLVSQLQTGESDRGEVFAFTLALPESLGLGGIMAPRLAVANVASDTGDLQLFLGYFHAFKLSKEKIDRLATVGKSVFDRVNGACGSTARPVVTCRYYAPFHWSSC